MNEINNYITELYGQLAEGESMPISEDAINDSIRCIDNFQLNDSKSLFTIVAALNLLNAAIKKEGQMISLDYGYIKTNVSKVADFYLSNKERFKDSSAYYELSNNCFLFNIFGVIFSFHQIKETSRIINEAASSEPIIWSGIRLQRIAQPVFEYGKQICTGEANTEIKKEIRSIDKAVISLIPCPDCGKAILFACCLVAMKCQELLII